MAIAAQPSINQIAGEVRFGIDGADRRTLAAVDDDALDQWLCENVQDLSHAMARRSSAALTEGP